ncbi:MAG: PQQ-like beta-propeller repeat protein [Chloroflexi bacterium]|nr:PQQ-like beta-propeller repeat protein [Chloroflexota bacterium]
MKRSKRSVLLIVLILTLLTITLTQAIASTSTTQAVVTAHAEATPTASDVPDTSITQIAAPGEWPQLQHDPQRTGYTPETVNPPFQLAWYRNFQPERVSPNVQAIVCDGKVFVPTEAGNLYALDATNGQELWRYNAGSAVLHTAACEAGKVIIATLDGSVHAVATATGALVWRFQAGGHTGFSSAPLIAESTVFIGERAGIFYALDLETGSQKWSFDAGAPILNTAAYNNGRVYFCDEAMYVHALNSQTGAEVWRSEKLYGQSCRQYHPVVYQGYVMIRPMMTHTTNIIEGIAPFNRTWNAGEYSSRIQQYNDFLYGGSPMPQELRDAQSNVVQYFTDHPYEQSLFILNESDGRQAFIPPHFHAMTLPGPPPPPVADGKGGVVIPWIFIGYGWGRLNLQTQLIDDIILPPPPFSGGNATENVNASVGGDLLYLFHTQEANAQWTGVFDWRTRQFYPFSSNDVPRRWWQLTDNVNNANNSVSIANGYFYHIVFHQIAAWTSQ